MDYNLIKLVIVFAIIVAIIWAKKPLHWAFIAGIIATALICMIPVDQCGKVIWSVVTDWGKMAIVLDIYLITFLQRLLDKRKQIQLAQVDMINLFNNRIVNALLIPIIIGFLPSPAALILCGEIVDQATGDYMDAKEKAIITSYFRHIPESFLPTYPVILLLCGFSGLPISSFVIAMLPPVIVLFVVGYFVYLRKLPTKTGMEITVTKKEAAIGLFKHIWSLVLIMVLIMGVGLSVEISIGIVLLLCFIVYKVTPKEIVELLPKAFDKVMILSTLMIFIFQGFLSHAGILASLISAFQALPIPAFIMFALLIFVGGVLTGAQGIIAVVAPLAFAAIPGFGIPLVMLLGCFAWASNQLSPTHVCVVVAANYFKVDFSDMVKKVIPCLAVYLVFAFLYYHVLLLFM